MRAFLATTVAAVAASKDINSLIKSFKSTESHKIKKDDLSLVQEHLNSLPSNEQSEKEWHEDMKGLKEKVKKIEGQLTPSKALEMLREHMPSGQVDQIQNLIQRHQQQQPATAATGTGESAVGSAANVTDEKDEFVRAMKALNNMTIEVDDTRINTLTECTQQLFRNYRTQWQHNMALVQIIIKLQKLNGKIFEAYNDKGKAEKKLDLAKQDETTTMSDMEGKNTKLLNQLAAKQKQVSLYAFIMRKVGASCQDSQGGSGSAPAGSLLQLTDQKKAECQKTCAEAGPKSRNAAMLKVFSDPGVVEAAKDALDDPTMEIFGKHLANLEEAEAEHVHPKYQKKNNFLQQSESPGGNYKPWSIQDQARGCGCGSLSDVGCGALAVIIGQELECANGLVRDQEAENEEWDRKMKDMQQSFQDQKDAHSESISSKQEEINGHDAAFKSYVEDLIAKYHAMIQFIDDTKMIRWKCFTRLSDLESNKYCAIRHIREHMKKETLKAFGLDPYGDDVIDCEYADFAFPQGKCPVNCYDTDLPHEKDLATIDWVRAEKESQPSAPEGMDGVQLQCPKTISMPLPCNAIICPTPCILADWEPWSTCTAKCNGGYTTRKRKIMARATWGGPSCGETVQSTECETDPCDKQCELHADFHITHGCNKACHFQDEGPSKQLLRKDIWKEAEGKGECWGYNHELRQQIVDCDREQQHPCSGQEICAQKMDLVILFECSTGTTRLGCWLMSSFVVDLLKRVATYKDQAPKVKVGLVRFGNGKSLAPKEEGGSYGVMPAQKVTQGFLSSDIASATKPLNDQARQLMKVGGFGSIGQEGQRGSLTKWEMGFNNLGQGLKAAWDLLDSSDRGQDTYKKIMILTAGKKIECTIAATEAKKYKDKGVVIDAILFAADYDLNPDNYAGIQDVVTFPHSEHLYVHSAGLHTMSNEGNRASLIAKRIPTMCPEAVSPQIIHQNEEQNGYLLLREATSCDNWHWGWCGQKGQMDLDQCVARISKINARFAQTDRDGYQGFIWREKDGGEECNCKFHHRESRKPQHINGIEIDGTCTTVPKYSEEKEKAEYEGWKRQLPGDWNHYAMSSGTPTPPFDDNWIRRRFAQNPEAATGSFSIGSMGSMGAATIDM